MSVNDVNLCALEERLGPKHNTHATGMVDGVRRTSDDSVSSKGIPILLPSPKLESANQSI